MDQLLSRMTVEEKPGQLTQYPGQWTSTGPWVSTTNEGEIRAGRVGSFFNIFGAETTKRLQHIAVEESRLGIPILFGAAGIHWTFAPMVDIARDAR